MKKLCETIFFCCLSVAFFGCSENKKEASTETSIPDSEKMRVLLMNVGLGNVDPDSVTLTSSQRGIIDSLILLDPNGYNAAQKSLGNTNSENYPLERLIVSVGLGKINPDSVVLTMSQKQAIDSIISLAPDAYNEAQKKLVKK